MCGLPLSGKSRWIESHQPSVPGAHIYVDSCAHTADIRHFIADRIRHIAKSEVHCVWVRESLKTCIGRVVSNGDEAKASLRKRQVERVASSFEAPDFHEPFNSIILLKD